LFNSIVPSLEYSGGIPDLLQAFDDWQKAGSDEELKAAASKAQLIWAEQVPKIPLVTSNAIWVNHKKVHGWMPTQTMLYPQYNDVWVEPEAARRQGGKAARKGQRMIDPTVCPNWAPARLPLPPCRLAALPPLQRLC